MSGQRHIEHTLQKRVSNSPLASSRGGYQSKPNNVTGLSLKSQLDMRRGGPSEAAYCRGLERAISAIELPGTGLLSV